MAPCPYCGAGGFIAKPYPEASECDHCKAVFYGSDRPANRLRCTNPRCQREWIYTGKRAYPAYVACPTCHSSVRAPISEA